MSWSQARDVYRVVFLVGDAPPHMDYQDDVRYPVTCKAAAQKKIVVNTVQCGTDAGAKSVWQEIATRATGDYFHVSQSGSAVAAVTPFDDELARVSAELDATRVYYGDRSVRDAAAKRKAVGEAINSGASVAAQARRAAFNASDAGVHNFYGANELLNDLAAGRVALGELETAALPGPMQKMTPAERQRYVADRTAARASLQAKVRALASKRQAHIQKQLEKNAAAARDSFSQKVYDSVRRQAAERDIHYASEHALH
jgi:Skp family chaperone for outer membrane proteins